MNDTSTENVLGLKEKFHLYYLYIAIILFAAAPIIYKMVSNLSRNEYRYAIILFFLGSILVPYLKDLGLLNHKFILTYSLSISYMTIGYSIIGYYLFKYRESIPRIYSIIGFISIFIMIKILIENPSEKNFVTYFEMVNPLSFLYATSVFLFLIKSKNDTDLSFISNSTLFIYTMHIILLEFFLRSGLYPSAFKDFEAIFPIIISLLIIVVLIIPLYIFAQLKKMIR